MQNNVAGDVETIPSISLRTELVELKPRNLIDKRTTYLAFKRTCDIVGSLIGLMLLFVPITIIVKIAYVCTGDFAPIFYFQERIGKNGKKFKLYKYRSMVPNADAMLTELLKKDELIAKEYNLNKKLKNDPRITKVGKVIRKISIDELPQLINIFLGDMSFIGNRPYLPREKDDMGNFYKNIVESKPGLTGLWQTNGRSNTTFKTRCKMEANYSKDMSLLLDIKIFFKTFIVIFKGL